MGGTLPRPGRLLAVAVSETRCDELACAYGADGSALVKAMYAPFSPSWLRNLPVVEALQVMTIQNYVRPTDWREREVVRRRRSSKTAERECRRAECG